MTRPETLEPSRRALTETERRTLRARIASVTARARRTSSAAVPVGVAVIVALWLWTLLASDAPWLVVTLFWLAAGGAITLWVRRDMGVEGRQMEGVARGLESAVRRNAADVYDVRATAFAELEEIEDEGACYAFDIGGRRLLFIQGQEFYEGARFPSLDFSLVYVLDEADRTVEMLIDKRGAKVAPTRKIPPAVKQGLEVPEHLEVLTGTLDDLEAILPAFSSARR